MTNFLAQEISAMKHIEPAAVDLHIIPWSNPMVLTDSKPCNNCASNKPDIWSNCNKEQAVVSSSGTLTVVDYEGVVADFYHGKNKPKHCDFVIVGNTPNGKNRIALCDLTCQKEIYVNNPSPSIKYPSGKREYAWTQMEETTNRWQAKASYTSMIGQYSQKVYLFGWRDPYVPVIAGNAGSKAMNAFSRSTTSSNVGVVTFGTRGNFELIQVKYPTKYEW